MACFPCLILWWVIPCCLKKDITRMVGRVMLVAINPK